MLPFMATNDFAVAFNWLKEICIARIITGGNPLTASDTYDQQGAEMYMLRIEHSVLNYDRWKEAFDSDPGGREKSGVRRYQILRLVNELNYVMIDLEFDTESQAESFLAAMRSVWGQVEGKIIMGPQARIVEAIETKVY